MHNGIINLIISVKQIRGWVSLTTISFPLFSGNFASLRAATVLAPDDIPTCKYYKEGEVISMTSFRFLIYWEQLNSDMNSPFMVLRYTKERPRIIF